MYSTGDIVDLNDLMFGWRGQYIVMAKKVDTPLVKIRNLATGSQQFVNPDRLRKSRLSQFFIKSLMPGA
jgi:hypothetical protein